MVLPLFQKVANLSQKVGFFLPVEPIFRADFSDKMLTLSNKESVFVLVSGFFSCCILFLQFCPSMTWRVLFSIIQC